MQVLQILCLSACCLSVCLSVMLSFSNSIRFRFDMELKYHNAEYISPHQCFWIDFTWFLRHPAWITLNNYPRLNLHATRHLFQDNACIFFKLWYSSQYTIGIFTDLGIYYQVKINIFILYRYDISICTVFWHYNKTKLPSYLWHVIIL